MLHKSSIIWTSACLLAGTVLSTAAPAFAQQENAAIEDIVVTARKREETTLQTPVILVAVGSKELERRQITSIDNLIQVSPGLVSGEGGGSVQGGIISIRGIGSGESNPFVDQSISFNIDGVAVANAGVRRLADIDLAQVEILKGPQALFFGKNSPGGIISMHTGDPTDHFKERITLGYEINAQEKQVQGFLSGPLTPDLGVRVSFYGDDMRGWVSNRVPTGELLQPAHRTGPYGNEFAGRVVFKYDPGERFDARLSFSGNTHKGSGAGYNTQIMYCPFGAPQGGPGTTGPSRSRRSRCRCRPP